ncbi:unnamed protein product [Mytilus coruscus]|uniref:Uncharacterized protein n=1 Tax=Mytilus coruscus TaxID=42192 RepID=A0A6J8AYM9_MYTCO|nr:unnamed protein product [Mytilus coruscus]
MKNWPRIVEQVEMGPMREACAAGGWSLPSQFTLVPVNSPGGRIGPVKSHRQASASWGASPRLETVVSRPRPITVDAHFHLDRAWAKTNLPCRPNLRQYMEMRLPSSQLYDVDVRGGVINFCDPLTWPSDKELEARPELGGCHGGAPEEGTGTG